MGNSWILKDKRVMPTDNTELAESATMNGIKLQKIHDYGILLPHDLKDGTPMSFQQGRIAAAVRRLGCLKNTKVLCCRLLQSRSLQLLPQVPLAVQMFTSWKRQDADAAPASSSEQQRAAAAAAERTAGRKWGRLCMHPQVLDKVWSLASGQQILAPVRVFTSEALAASKSRPAVDGNGNSACGNCQTVASGHLKWVRLDLGMARTVTQVRLYNPQQGSRQLGGCRRFQPVLQPLVGMCMSDRHPGQYRAQPTCTKQPRGRVAASANGRFGTWSSASGLRTDFGDRSAKSLKIRLGDARTAASYAGTLSSVSAVAAATLSGTQSRICGPLAPFTKVDTGFCEDYGYQAIRTSVHCGLAAQSMSSCAASSTCGVWTYDISSKACKIFTAGSAGLQEACIIQVSA
eukprot:s2209_g7.t1